MSLMEKSIVEAQEVSLDHIHGLLEGRYLFVRVPGYYPADAAEKLSSALEESPLHGAYVNAPDIGRVGQAFFESQAGAEVAARYSVNAVNWIREMRRAVFPGILPIDRLRLELDETWHCGANLGVINDAKMFAGLTRTFRKGAAAEPHQDVLAWDAPGNEHAAKIRGQLAANVYLRVSEKGGELSVWPISFSKEAYEERKVAGSYGLKPETLASRKVSVAPRQGELILFNANLVHAVEEIVEGGRITCSCFIGFRAHNEPLMIWS